MILPDIFQFVLSGKRLLLEVLHAYLIFSAIF